MRIDRRRFLLGSAGLAGAGLVAACSDDAPSASAPPTTTNASGPVSALESPGSSGLVDEDTWQARVDEYLEVATTELDPTSRASVAAHLARSRREPNYT